MKKAEELAEKYTEEKIKPWDLDFCAQNACFNGFMAGYKAALSTKTDLSSNDLICSLEAKCQKYEAALRAICSFSSVTMEGQIAKEALE